MSPGAWRHAAFCALGLTCGQARAAAGAGPAISPAASAPTALVAPAPTTAAGPAPTTPTTPAALSPLPPAPAPPPPLARPPEHHAGAAPHPGQPRVCPVDAEATLIHHTDAKTPDGVARLADQTDKLLAGQDLACAERVFLLFRTADDAALTAYASAQAPDGWPVPLPPQKRAKVTAALGRAGWRLGGESEGSYLFEVDPAWLGDRFGARLPESWRLYFQQRAREVNEGFVEDDGLAISWASLAGRIGFWDRFLARYPDFPEAAALRAANDTYLHAFVYGLDNTPVHDDRDVPRVVPEVRQAYAGFIQSNPASPHAALLKAYLGYLEAHDGRFDDAARAFLDSQLR